jgi:hypothetical protein
MGDKVEPYPSLEMAVCKAVSSEVSQLTGGREYSEN